jgi:heat shock protein HslJ
MKKILMFISLLFTIAGTAYTQQTIAVQGSWKLVSGSVDVYRRIPQTPVPELNFDPAGRITGFTGCNQLTGEYTMDKDQISLGPLIITKKSCENMRVEMMMQQFLPTVGSYKVEKDKLYLYDRTDTKRYLMFSRTPASI